MHQNAYRVCRQGQCAVGVFRFQRGFDYFAILPRDGSLNFQCSVPEVHIRPLQSQQFPTAYEDESEQDTTEDTNA